MTTINYLEELVTNVNKAVKEDNLNFASLVSPPYPLDIIKYIEDSMKDGNKLPDQIKKDLVLAGSGVYIRLARAYALRKGPKDREKAENYIAKAESDSNKYNVVWTTEVNNIREILSNGKKK